MEKDPAIPPTTKQLAYDPASPLLGAMCPRERTKKRENTSNKDLHTNVYGIIHNGHKVEQPIGPSPHDRQTQWAPATR